MPIPGDQISPSTSHRCGEDANEEGVKTREGFFGVERRCRSRWRQWMKSAVVLDGRWWWMGREMGEEEEGDGKGKGLCFDTNYTLLRNQNPRFIYH